MAFSLIDRVDEDNPLPVAVISGGTGGSGGGLGTNASPNIVREAQNAPTHATRTLAAATPQTIIAAGASANGARILNWTTAPVYVIPGEAGTPVSGAPSDYIPAAASGVPGQYEPPYIPTGGLRAVGAAAGDLSVITW